jgi:hypothetical protein
MAEETRPNPIAALMPKPGQPVDPNALLQVLNGPLMQMGLQEQAEGATFRAEIRKAIATMNSNIGVLNTKLDRILKAAEL